MRNAGKTDVASIKDEGNFLTTVHARLAFSGAALVALQLDDVLRVSETQT